MKAYSKGAKRRRKRKTIKADNLNVPARPAGYDEVQIAAFAETARARKERYGVSLTFAKSKECGHPVGRLLHYERQRGRITEEQERDYLQAADHYHQVMDYMRRHLWQAPRATPKALDMNAVGGRDVSAADPDRDRAMTGQWGQIETTIGVMDTHKRIGHALRSAIIEEANIEMWPAQMVTDLLKGLELLSGLLTDGKKKAM
jgi:hypothetical protein